MSHQETELYFTSQQTMDGIMNDGSNDQDDNLVKERTLSVIELEEGVSSSLPTAEEVKISVGGPTSASEKHGRKTLIRVAIGVLLLAAVLAAAVATAVVVNEKKSNSKRGNDLFRDSGIFQKHNPEDHVGSKGTGSDLDTTPNTATTDTTPDAAKDDTEDTATPSATHADAETTTDATRKATLASVIQFLKDENISDATLLDSETSHQHRAARWLAESDSRNLAVPTTTKFEMPGYRYMFRYVMALNFYAMKGQGWVNHSFFLAGRDTCGWHFMEAYTGVFCDADNIPFAVILPNNNLVSEIPPENGLLRTLQYFNVKGNHLGGSIPDLCFPGLKTLDVSHNKLTGSIPSCLGDDTDLYELYLNNNLLEGHVPTSLGALTNLTELFVDDNMLTGNPTEIFSKMTKLGLLMANNNGFTGSFHSGFLKHSELLRWIDVSHNKFDSSKFPTHLFSLPMLEVLDVSVNRLSGSIPNSIPENTQLKFLAAYDNRINGTIPATIQNLDLMHLDLSDNQLTGEMSSVFGEMSTLALLFLSNNPFNEGEVPKTFGNLKALRELSLRGTNRVGALPALSGFDSLDLLDLSSNKFTGAIPESYGDLNEINYMLLNDNAGIVGELPATFGNLTFIQALYIDGTALTGNVDVMCHLPLFKASPDDTLTIFADCDGDTPEISCSCDDCLCCMAGTKGGCSEPYLSNLDVSYENTFRRKEFVFSNSTITDMFQ